MNFGTLTAPTIDPPGGPIEGQVTVSLSAQAGMTIRYTTNGASPTTSSTIYTAPFVIDTTKTVKARAFHPDYTTSAETSATYTVTASRPVLTVASGTYAPGTAVTITTPDSTATIRITLNGVDPTSADRNVPSGTTLLVGGFTLKARAFRSGATDSAVTSATYSLTVPLTRGVAAAGATHTVLATPEGLLYAWGSAGQVGNGSSLNQLSPALIHTLTGVTALAASDGHTLAATFDGRLFAWGANGSGALGDGTTNTQPTPVQISGLPAITAVAAGYSHSLALSAGGDVYSWGSGSTGQLGLGATTVSLTPVLISGLSNVVAIAAGESHSLAVTSSGQLFAWGNNASSQLGDGGTTSSSTPKLIPGIEDVVAIDAGTYHSIALLRNGDAYAWGVGTSGQLGQGDFGNKTVPTKIAGFAATMIAAGKTHSMAFNLGAVLKSFGANSSGQLGDTSTTPRNAPVSVSVVPAVTAFSAGGSHSVAVAPNGQVWTWGAGGSGQLGVGTPITSQPTPQMVLAAPGRWAPAAPALSLASGTFDTAQTVSITADPSAVVRYTTTGLDPIDMDPEVPPGGQINIDGTTSLRARAWANGSLPSVTASTIYILQPSTPVISPAAATYTSPQTVSMTTATSGTSIRYTLDGSDPTATSTEYTAPFTVNTQTTVKARAFRSAWTASDLSTVTYTFNYGTLSTPVASPPSGRLHPNETIALSAQAGATIRYTLDGTDPTASSTLYVAPISLGEGSFTLKARAFRVDWMPSAVMTTTYLVTSDWTPPTITASLSPAPNAAGWNTSSVTVTFTCVDADSPIASCTGPQTVTQEGAGATVVGVALDTAGNQATLTVTAHVDSSPPALTRYAPRDTDVFALGTTSVTVRGSAADFSSGIASVTCGGVAGVLDGQRYACAAPVTTGSNVIAIVATDVAGLVTTLNVTIEVGEAPAPTSIEITPATMTLIAGESRELQITDQRGELVTGGTWTVSNTAIAEVTVIEGETVVRALAAGEATLTLTRVTLTAEAVVNVLSANSTIPSGTTLWSLNGAAVPKRGQVFRAMWIDTEADQPSLFFVDEGTEWNGGIGTTSTGGWARPFDKATVIRAATMDGRELWKRTFSGTVVRQFAADEHGGLVVLIHDDNTLPVSGSHPMGYAPHVIRRYDGPDGHVSWEYQAYWNKNDASRVTDFAIAPDGRVFFVEHRNHAYYSETYLVALDAPSGGMNQWELPLGTAFGFSVSPKTTPPLVLEDGSVVVLSSRRQGDIYELQRIVLPSGVPELTVTPVNTGALTQFDASQYRLMPDGSGGLLVTSARFGNASGTGSTHYVGTLGTSIYRVDTNSLLSGPLTLVPNLGAFYNVGVYQADYVLGDDAAWAYLEGFSGGTYWAKTFSFDPVSLTLGTDTELGASRQTPWHLRTRSAVGGGGIYLSGPTDAFAVGASVDAGAFAGGGSASYVGAGGWAGWGGPSLALGGRLPAARSTYAQPIAGGSAAERNPYAGIFAKAHDIGPDLIRHVSIRMAPRNQAFWRNHPNATDSIFKHQDWRTGTLFFGTLGAGATDPPCSGLLKSDSSRDRDVNRDALEFERLNVPTHLEDVYIGRLLQRDANYDDDLVYDCVPDPLHGYNSNSYAHGLLDASNLPTPPFMQIRWQNLLDFYPGWDKPVPKFKFDP